MIDVDFNPDNFRLRGVISEWMLKGEFEMEGTKCHMDVYTMGLDIHQTMRAYFGAKSMDSPIKFGFAFPLELLKEYTADELADAFITGNILRQSNEGLL